MKKRILLAALLVVPMGAAFAWHESRTHTQSGDMNQDEYEAVLGTQTGRITTSGATSPASQSQLGTQSATITTGGPEAQSQLGTQSATGYITTGGTLGTQSYGR